MKKLHAVLPVVAAMLVVGSVELCEVLLLPADAEVPALVAKPMPSVVVPLAPPVTASAAPVDVAPAPSFDAAPGAPGVDPAPLQAYVETAMRAWAKETSKSASYDDVSRDIAEVVASEDPAYDDDVSRGRTAILLTTLAYFEGARFARYVDDGSCNDKAWRKSKAGYDMVVARADCDAGWAVSLFQVHPATFYFGNGQSQFVSMDDLKDRKTATRVALRIARRSLHDHAGLCEYSGEPAPCPKASLRLRFAENYSTKHPFQP